MESSFKAAGAVGIAITDELYIDFSPPKDFNEALKELIDTINVISTSEQVQPGR